MCTWPKGEGAVQQGFDFYFNECMNGFEHQVAGHMIWEGMVQEGLAVSGDPRPLSCLRGESLERGRVRRPLCPLDGQLRRLPGRLRLRISRPEGTYRFCPAALSGELPSGFHGGRGLGPVPPDAFRRHADGHRGCAVGQGRLRNLSVAIGEDLKPQSVHVKAGDAEVACKHAARDGKVTIELAAEIVLDAGQNSMS